MSNKKKINGMEDKLPWELTVTEQLEKRLGHEPQADFYNEFSKAEEKGVEALHSTFDNIFSRILKEWENGNYKLLTEFALVLRMKTVEQLRVVQRYYSEKAGEYMEKNYTEILKSSLIRDNDIEVNYAKTLLRSCYNSFEKQLEKYIELYFYSHGGEKGEEYEYFRNALRP